MDTLRQVQYGLQRDSIVQHRLDSLQKQDETSGRRKVGFYERLENSHRRVPRLIYHLLFAHSVRDTTVMGEVVDERMLFDRYAGRTVCDIVIEQEPVFDGHQGWLDRMGNSMHKMTQERVLRRDLLFRLGDTIAPERLVQNLQLLRSRSYIADAQIILKPNPHDTTQLTVVVRTRDSWTIGVDATWQSEGRTTLGLSDANILGSGNLLKVITGVRRTDFSYGGNQVTYAVPNLFGSFLKAELDAGRTFYESIFHAGIDRSFILPNDYGLGASYDRLKEKYYLVDRDTSDLVKYRSLNMWIGKSFPIALARSNLFFTARYTQRRYLLRPEETDAHYNPAFHNREDVLLGFGLYREKFYTGSMIYGFGTREYLATGYKFETVSGYSWREFGEDFYLGLSYKGGRFTQFGYLMGGLSMGSYIDCASGKWTQSAVDINMRWFSPLFIWGGTHIRQFFALNYTQGWNRLEGSNEVIRFTAQDGLSLLDKNIYGITRMTLNTETVFFTRFQPLGFRVALFGFTDSGMLGQHANPFENPFYMTLGVGIRLRNERLVFKAVQLRLGITFGKGGWVDDCRYVRLSNETRVEQYRYRPTQPEIVRFE
jgi:hypothetical protein